MSVRWFACAAVALLLAGCGSLGPGPGVTGNDTGGIIPYASVDRYEARAAAIEHCARYGKIARSTAVDARYGGYYSFSCLFDKRRLNYER